jgi:hypothetical protein
VFAREGLPRDDRPPLIHATPPYFIGTRTATARRDTSILPPSARSVYFRNS